MESAGLETERIARVVGLASSVLFDKENPRSPVNRRISIVVMTQQAEQDAQKVDLPDAGVVSEAAPGTAPDAAIAAVTESPAG
jgi:chemotaxis protein MotB